MFAFLLALAKLSSAFRAVTASIQFHREALSAELPGADGGVAVTVLGHDYFLESPGCFLSG